MTPEDRRVAREALERGALSVDQVGEISASAEADGLSFAEAARRRGVKLPSPAAPAPAPSSAPARLPVFPVLLALSLAVLVAIVWLTVVRAALDASEHGDAETEVRAMMDAEEAAARARGAYEKTVSQREAAEAARALAKAREALAEAETRFAGRPAVPAELRDSLLQAAQRFGIHLAANPRDADVLLERARAWELYGLPDRARADLEAAVRLKPALADRAAPALKRISGQ